MSSKNTTLDSTMIIIIVNVFEFLQSKVQYDVPSTYMVEELCCPEGKDGI